MRVIQRADELASSSPSAGPDGRVPLSAQVKKGLAAAFNGFDESTRSQSATTQEAVKLRDVLFLCHAPSQRRRAGRRWKRLVADELRTPDTWRPALSSEGGDKRAHWERLAGKKDASAPCPPAPCQQHEGRRVQRGLHRPFASTPRRIGVCFPSASSPLLARTRVGPVLERAIGARLQHRESDPRTQLAQDTVLLVDLRKRRWRLLGPLGDARTDALTRSCDPARRIAEKVSITASRPAQFASAPARFALRIRRSLAKRGEFASVPRSTAHAREPAADTRIIIGE